MRNEKEEALRAEKEKAKREAQTVEDEHRKVCADLGAKITAAEIKANDCYKRMDELQMTRLKNY